MKWTEDMEIQKVRRMRLANIPIIDAVHFSMQHSITKIIFPNVKTQGINNSTILLGYFICQSSEKGRLLADDKL